MDDNPDVLDMAAAQLKTLGYDGLFSEYGECACVLDDLAPCGEIRGSCRAGYRVDFEDGCDGEMPERGQGIVEYCGAGGGCDFHIEVKRREPGGATGGEGRPSED